MPGPRLHLGSRLLGLRLWLLLGAGEWVLPPRVGFLWTPGYWGYSGGSYLFNDGYWGPSVGFYGGINYGNGYYGSDYYGGRWVGDNFYYNTAASRVNPNVIRNTYVDRQVVQSTRGARASFNGPGGVQAAPSLREQALANAEHVAPTSAQQSRVAAAKNDPALRTADNKGQPKANAVRTFESKQRSTGAETAAAAKNGSVNTAAGAKNDSVNTAAGAKNDSVKTAAAAKNGSAKTARNERVATSHARNSTQARHSGSRKGASASYAGRHQQAAVHHQRMASSYPRHVAPHSQRTASYRQQASHGGQRVASQGKGGGGGGKSARARVRARVPGAPWPPATLEAQNFSVLEALLFHDLYRAESTRLWWA